jgi:general secretion pathway protein M
MKDLRTWWQQRAPRERLLLGLGTACVLLALVWWLAVAPPWQTLRSAPARLAQLEAQAAQMRSAQAEAKRLRALPAPSAQDARRQVADITREQLGARAQVAWSGESAQVRFEAVAPEALARWLQAVRLQAYATPVQMQIRPATAPTAGTQADAAGGLISGLVSVNLSTASP